jgi:hypothetical protein
MTRCRLFGASLLSCANNRSEVRDAVMTENNTPINAAFRQHFFHIPKAQRKSEVEPNCALDDHWRKSVAGIENLAHSPAITCSSEIVDLTCQRLIRFHPSAKDNWVLTARLRSPALSKAAMASSNGKIPVIMGRTSIAWLSISFTASANS